MKCVNCDEHFEIEDYEDTTPFQCEYCGVWLKLDIDESSYLGAKQTNLIMLDEQDLDEV